MSYRYKKNITQDNQVFTFADLGATLDSLTLPTFTNAPIINILAVQGDAIINLHPDYPPTATEFTIIVGSVGQVPSVANPIPFWFDIISQDEDEEEVETTHLVTAAWVKARFPEWETLCTRSDGLKTASEMLDIAIEMAENRLQEYTGTLTEDDLTDSMSLHLLKIIKYECFQFSHGDTEFKDDPQYIKDYKETIELLKKGLIGSDNITLESKDRLFDDWFTDQETIWYE